MDVHRGSDISGGGRTRSSSRLKRKPFSDLTNAPSSSNFLKTKPKPRPAPDPKPASSTTAGWQENDGDLATSTSTRRKDVANNDKLDTFTVSRQPVKAKIKDKEKTVEAGTALSCPPVERNRSIEGNICLKDRLSALHKAFSAPRERPKKVTNISAGMASGSFAISNFIANMIVHIYSYPQEDYTVRDPLALRGVLYQLLGIYPFWINVQIFYSIRSCLFGSSFWIQTWKIFLDLNLDPKFSNLTCPMGSTTESAHHILLASLMGLESSNFLLTASLLTAVTAQSEPSISCDGRPGYSPLIANRGPT